ncbi:MAG: lysophospholipid acyltransferase family protein [Acidobacteriota bacterium]|nr:MAG: lysophospholipid acyltransferase family protein [Acidobacteriota bacterium]
MLKAAKSKWFELLFAAYNTNLLRRRFHSFRVRGLDNLPGPRRSLPLLIYANHTSWWDGLAAFQISRKTGLDAYVMMEEKHLRRYLLFRKLGAFSVVRDSPRSAYRSLEYAASLMKDDPRRALWMFPQGEIVPAGRRPLGFYSGIEKLIELTGGCIAVPVVFRYEFEGAFKPSVYAAVGEAIEISESEPASVRDLEERMELTLDDLEGAVLNRSLDGFRDLI